MRDNILYQGDNSEMHRRAQATLKAWRDDPVLFVRQVLHVTDLEPWQVTGLRNYAKENHISVRSGHGVGKSAWLSWCIIHFTVTHFPCKVPCTAPTSHQLEDVLWGELALWRRRMHAGLADLFEVTSDRMYLKLAPDECYAAARTARKENPDALQGFHSENIMFVVEEASGVPDEIFQPLEGALSTPGAKSIMAGNPTRPRGYFYDSHHRNRSHFCCMKVSCEESSRVSKQYIDKMAKQYGIESNVYKVRVLGEFPDEAADTLIPLSIAEPSIGRPVDISDHVMPVWALDVARYGECLNSLSKRRGNTLTEPIKTWGNVSTMVTVGKVYSEYMDTQKEDRPHEVIVDVIGVGGGVVDRLAELGVPVRGVNVGEAPPQNEFKRFQNLRAYLWWQMREWFMSQGCHIPEEDADQLISELTDVHYSLTSSGKIVIEGKKEMLDRGVPSPDRADSLMLTFAGSIVTTDDWEAEKRKYRPPKRRDFMSS